MAKLTDIFTDKEIRALSKPGRHRDGDGLYLYIAPGAPSRGSNES